MARHFFLTPEDLYLFNLINLPVWVFDLEHHGIWWGNSSALEFWKCADAAALVARDFSDDTETVRTRLRQTVAGKQLGEATHDSWTLYPDGVPTPVDIRFTYIQIGPERRDAMLIEATPAIQSSLEENDRRLVEAVRHSSIMIRYFALDGSLRFANPAAIDAFDAVTKDLPDPADAFAVCLARPSLATDMFEKCIQQNTVSGEFEVRTRNGTRWHRIELRQAIDPEFGDRCILVIEEDVTSIKHAETAAAMSERLLYDAIESLSVGFIMLDANGHVVMINSKYKEMHQDIAPYLNVGMPFEQILRASATQNLIEGQEGRGDAWVQDRMDTLGKWADGVDFQLADGRWVRVYESHTSDGGVAGSRMDITELKRAQQEAIDANQAKTEFLSSMSHELRTPLNSVMGFAQILEYDHDNPLNDRQHYAVDMIIKSSDFLLELIKEVLDLSRIETGTIRLQITDIDPVAAVNDSIAAAHTLADARGIKMTALPDDLELPRIAADEVRLKQVLLNLLSNAVKYNDDSGTVTIGAVRTDTDTVRISITDTGAGIAAKDHDKVFLPFDRLGRESQSIEGTGVGLTITKSLVEYMKGKIGFTSKLGEGSTFWIDLPVWDEVRNNVQDDTAQAPE